MDEFDLNAFGICPKSGIGATEAPASELTGANAQTSIDTDRIPIGLLLFRGEFVCARERRNQIKKDKQRIRDDKYRREDVFVNRFFEPLTGE